MTAHYQNHGDGLESLVLAGPDGRATLTTWLHNIEVETLPGRLADPDDPATFEAEGGEL